MAISKKTRFLMIAAASLVVGGWWGYRSERRAIDDAGAPKVTVRKMVKRLVTPKAERAGVDRLEEQRQSIGRKDPSRSETAALWSTVRGLSVEEVKSVLEGLPPKTGLMVNEGLIDMLYYRWAQLEPEAAIAAAVSADDKERYLIFHTILSAWAQRDPEAAIRWGRESDNRIAKNAAVQLAARHWVEDDPATAISRARAEFPMAESSVFASLIAKLSGSPESRAKFYAILAKDSSEQSAGHLVGVLASNIGMNGLEGVATLADEMAAAGLPEKWIESFRGQSNRNLDQRGDRELLTSGEEGAALTDESRQDACRRWVFNGGDEAGAWAAAKGDTELVASMTRDFADNLLQSDWTPGRETNASWADTVRKQFNVWKRMDAAAANAWLAIMPGDIKKLVATTATPEGDATH